MYLLFLNNSFESWDSFSRRMQTIPMNTKWRLPFPLNVEYPADILRLQTPIIKSISPCWPPQSSISFFIEFLTFLTCFSIWPDRETWDMQTLTAGKWTRPECLAVEKEFEVSIPNEENFKTLKKLVLKLRYKQLKWVTGWHSDQDVIVLELLSQLKRSQMINNNCADFNLIFSLISIGAIRG